MNLLSVVGERAEAALRLTVPYGLMVVLFALGSVSVPFVPPGIKAPFFLMGLYYWSIYRPTLIKPWMAFAAGMLTDLVGGLPPGLTAGVYVLTQWIVSDQRRFLMGQSFVMLWLGFVIVSVLTGLLQWGIFGLINLAWPPLRPFAFSVILGAALFPAVCVTLHWTHRILPQSLLKAPS